MLSRAFFIVIAVFWVIMNFLLVRQEFGSTKNSDSPVSLDAVWQKMLTAPDNSSLTIYQRREKLGFCRWSAIVAGDYAQKGETPQPEGQIKNPTGFMIDMEGNLFLGDPTNRLRFDLLLNLTSNNNFQSINLKVVFKPNTWELHGTSESEKFAVSMQGESGTWEQTFKFADLQKPERLLMSNPVAWALLNSMGISSFAKSTNLLSGLKLSAFQTLHQVGASKTRAYRIDGQLMEGLKASVYVSRAGEILRVQLPDGYVLVNEEIDALDSVTND